MFVYRAAGLAVHVVALANDDHHLGGDLLRVQSVVVVLAELVTSGQSQLLHRERLIRNGAQELVDLLQLGGKVFVVLQFQHDFIKHDAKVLVASPAEELKF